jgi:hypothetical protein
VGDWLYAQVQYETTDKSTAVIAEEVGTTVSEIVTRASRGGWTRSAVRTTATLAAELLIAEKTAKDIRRKNELEAIEKVNVAMQAEVLSTHRKDIKQAREVCGTLMGRLLSAIPADEDAEVLENLESSAGIMLKLSSSMKNLILLERQALGITTVIQDPETVNPSQTPQDAALDMLVNKFASVLQAHQPHNTIDMGSVTDVAPTEQRHATPADKSTA